MTNAKRADICLIPLSLFGVPAAAAGAVVLSRFGRYKVIHVIGLSLFTIGRGLYTLLGKNTTSAKWVAFQLLAGVGAGVGAGLLLNTLPSRLPGAPGRVGSGGDNSNLELLEDHGRRMGCCHPGYYLLQSYRYTDRS